jgi:hypothetical protein
LTDTQSDRGCLRRQERGHATPPIRDSELRIDEPADRHAAEAPRSHRHPGELSVGPHRCLDTVPVGGVLNGLRKRVIHLRRNLTFGRGSKGSPPAGSFRQTDSQGVIATFSTPSR